jgi:hypothetical protein
MTIADQPWHRFDRDADAADGVFDVAGGIERLMGDRGLYDLLDRGDCAALELLEQSAGALKAALGEPGFDAVARAAEDFDFEAALAALGRAKDGNAGS